MAASEAVARGRAEPPPQVGELEPAQPQRSARCFSFLPRAASLPSLLGSEL